MNIERYTSPGELPSSSSAHAGAAQPPKPSSIHLTPRESEIVRYVIRGESNKQIARRLGISNYTVRDHVSNLLKKSGVTSRSRLALALPAPLLQPPAAASPQESVSPRAVTHAPNGHSLHDSGLDSRKVALPWRK
jgi:DNA-binding CsgD family transcriptional regulator